MPSKEPENVNRSSESTSTKTPIIEHLFFWRYDEHGIRQPRYDEAATTMLPQHRIVYMDEVTRVAEMQGITFGNKYAFAKDLFRTDARERNWPQALKDKRWTGVQITGRDGTKRLRCYRYQPYLESQTVAFVEDCPLDPDAESIPVQSVTMSVASKQIERIDEPRIMQIAVELRIIETHFSLKSPLAKTLLHIDHLQMGMKLYGSEIDALFQAELGDIKSRERKHALMTVEVKQKNEHVTFSQIVAQVKAASTTEVDFDMIVPLALKHRPGGIHLVEFQAFDKASTDFKAIEPTDLEPVAEAFYVLAPPVSGLGKVADISASRQISFLESLP